MKVAIVNASARENGNSSSIHVWETLGVEEMTSVCRMMI